MLPQNNQPLQPAPNVIPPQTPQANQPQQPLAPTPLPKKSKKPLIIISIIGAIIVLVGLVTLSYFLFIRNTKPQETSQSSTAGKVTTSCYSYNAPLSTTQTDGCDAISLINNGGYFPITIRWYDTNSGGSFVATINELEAELKAASSSVKREQLMLDGVEAVKFTYSPKENSNRINLDSSTGQTYTPQTVFIMSNTSNLSISTGGKKVVAISIKTGIDTDSQQQELKNILDSWQWTR